MKGQVISIEKNGETHTGPYKINYILGTTTADNAKGVLTDLNGVPIYDINTGTTYERFYPICCNGQEVNGIKSKEFSSIKRIIVGVDKVIL